MTPRLFAVGVGPGDPDLITRKAERVLRSVDVICAPTGSVDAASYALAIVEPFVDRSRQKILTRVFPMRRDRRELEPYWEEVAAEMAAQVRSGRDVAFITIGDPFLYSTFLYLYGIFLEKFPDIPVEIVPGISSVSAAAAAAGVPLGISADRIAILPAVYEEEKLRRTLDEFDTVVLMKVHRVFDRIYELLRDLKLEKKAVYIRRVGSKDQEIITDLASLCGKKLDYLSMLLIRKSS